MEEFKEGRRAEGRRKGKEKQKDRQISRKQAENLQPSASMALLGALQSMVSGYPLPCKCLEILRDNN